MSNHLKKVTPLAKRLYASGRYKRYSDAVKEAFKQMPPKKVASVKKKHKQVPTKDSIKKLIQRVNKRNRKPLNPVGFKLPGTISGHTSALKKLYEEQLGKLYVQQYNAKLKRDKKAIGKKIAELKQKLRNHS